MRRASSRATGLIGLLGIVAIGLAACRVPPPLAHPLMLTPPVDATAEVHQLLGDPPAPAQSPTEVATQLAVRLTRQSPGCEVLTIAQVIWAAPSEPAAAAI